MIERKVKKRAEGRKIWNEQKIHCKTIEFHLEYKLSVIHVKGPNSSVKRRFSDWILKTSRLCSITGDKPQT